MPSERLPNPDQPLILAVSFYYPPAPQPQGGQAEQLLASAGLPVLLLRGRDPDQAPLSPPDNGGLLVPQAEVLVSLGPGPGRWQRWRARLTGGKGEEQPGWERRAAPAALRYVRLSGLAPRVLLSFGPPACGHLAGRTLAKELGLPWAALCTPSSREPRGVAKANLLLFSDSEAAERFQKSHQDPAPQRLRVLPQDPKQAGATLRDYLLELMLVDAGA